MLKKVKLSVSTDFKAYTNNLSLMCFSLDLDFGTYEYILSMIWPTQSNLAHLPGQIGHLNNFQTKSI